MQKAIYSPDTLGHYALASTCYCHFTSPIRRYPDLVVHRLLDEIIDQRPLSPLGERAGVRGKSSKKACCPHPNPLPEGEGTYENIRELVLLGEHCSDREQRAEEAERELKKLKLIDYMSRHLGEQMKAVITKVELFGVFVLGLEIPAEGLIRIEGLKDDFYRFERNAKILIGQREGNTFRIGDRVVVEVVRADMDARQIDFRLVKRLKTDRPTKKLKKQPVRRVKEKTKKGNTKKKKR